MAAPAKKTNAWFLDVEVRDGRKYDVYDVECPACKELMSVRHLASEPFRFLDCSGCGYPIRIVTER